MARNTGKSMETDTGAESGSVPPEAGGDGAASLFDATGDARVRVLRKDDRTQKFITHGFFPPGVNEEDVAMEFGGGDYRAQLVVQDDSGLSKVKRQRDFKIPGPYKPPTAELPGLRPVAVVGKTPSIPGIPPGADVNSFLNATMMSTFMDMIKTMKEMSTRPAPTTDPMLLEILKGQAATQGKLFELIMAVATGNNKGESKKELLELMASMKELIAPAIVTPPGGTPQSMLSDLVGAIKQLKDVSEEFSPDKGSGDPVMDSIPKLVEVLVEEQQMKKAGLNPGNGTQARRVPSPGTQPQQQVSAGDVPIWKRVLQREGPRLVSSAQAGRNPETIASIAVEFMPASIKGAMAEFFHRDTNEVAAQITAEIPALAEQPAWVMEFVDHAQFLMFPEEFDDDGERITTTTPEEMETTQP